MQVNYKANILHVTETVKGIYTPSSSFIYTLNNLLQLKYTVYKRCVRFNAYFMEFSFI